MTRERRGACRRYPDPEWFATIVAGDVLQPERGQLRRVIEVHRRQSGRLFAITLHRIHAGYSEGIGATTGPVPYFASELRTMRFRLVARELLDTPAPIGG